MQKVEIRGLEEKTRSTHKNRLYPKHFFILSNLIFLFIFISCDKNPTGPVEDNDGTPDVAKVLSVLIEAPRSLLAVGDTVQLKAIAKDAGQRIIEGKTFDWKSSDEQVVTISNDGLVSAVNIGTSTITATTDGISGNIGLVVPISVTVELNEDVPFNAIQHIQYLFSAIDSTRFTNTSNIFVSGDSYSNQLIFALSNNDVILLAGMAGSKSTSIGIESTAQVIIRFALGFLESRQIEAEQLRDMAVKSPNYNELLTNISIAVNNGISPTQSQEVLNTAYSVAETVYEQVSSNSTNSNTRNLNLQSVEIVSNPNNEVPEIVFPLPYYLIKSLPGERFKLDDVPTNNAILLFNETRLDWVAKTLDENGKQISEVYLPRISASLIDLITWNLPGPEPIIGNNKRFTLRIEQNKETQGVSAVAFISYILLFVFSESTRLVDPKTDYSCFEEVSKNILNSKLPDLLIQPSGDDAKAYLIEMLPNIFSGFDGTLVKCGIIKIPDTKEFLAILEIFGLITSRFLTQITIAKKLNTYIPQAHHIYQFFKYYDSSYAVNICKDAAQIKPCVGKIEIDTPKSKIAILEHMKITAKVIDVQGNDVTGQYTVNWTTSDKEIATIIEDEPQAWVRGHKEGDVFIIAQSGAKSDSILVKVEKNTWSGSLRIDINVTENPLPTSGGTWSGSGVITADFTLSDVRTWTTDYTGHGTYDYYGSYRHRNLQGPGHDSANFQRTEEGSGPFSFYIKDNVIMFQSVKYKWINPGAGGGEGAYNLTIPLTGTITSDGGSISGYLNVGEGLFGSAITIFQLEMTISPAE